MMKIALSAGRCNFDMIDLYILHEFMCGGNNVCIIINKLKDWKLIINFAFIMTRGGVP